MKYKMIIDVAGSYALRFVPGYYCGDKYGFKVATAKDFDSRQDFDAGGVIDFKDIDCLYRWSVEYRKKKK